MEKSGGGNSAMDNASTEFGQRRYHPSESSRIKDSLQRKLTNDEVSMVRQNIYICIRCGLD